MSPTEDQRQEAAFFWGEMEQYTEQLLAALRTASTYDVSHAFGNLVLARKEWLRVREAWPIGERS